MIVCNLEEYGHNERPVARVPEVAAPVLRPLIYSSPICLSYRLHTIPPISHLTQTQNLYFLQEILSPNVLVST